MKVATQTAPSVHHLRFVCDCIGSLLGIEYNS
jgi:hypothetical protein